MKTLFISFLLFCCLAVNSAYGQEETKLFAQGLFQIENEQEMQNVQNAIKELSSVYVVRLDGNTQRFFILTQGIEQLSEETLRNWFGDYSQTVRCIQIGIYGQDNINQYPFNCEE